MASQNRRVRIIHQQLSAYRTKILCQLYARLTEQVTPTALSAEILQTLEDCASQQPHRFQELLLDHLADQEQEVRARINGTGSRSSEEQEVVRAYDLVRARQAEQRYAYALTLGSRWERLTKEEGLELSPLRQMLEAIYSTPVISNQTENLLNAAKQLRLPSKLHRQIPSELRKLSESSAYFRKITHMHVEEMRKRIKDALHPLALHLALHPRFSPEVRAKCASLFHAPLEDYLPKREDVLKHYPALKALDTVLRTTPDLYQIPTYAVA